MTLPVFGEVISDTGYLSLIENTYAEKPWKLLNSSNDLKIWSACSENSDIKVFKAYMKFPNVSACTLFDTLMDTEYRKEWDINMIEGYELCQVNYNSDIGYYSLKAFPGISDRDFVLQRSWGQQCNEYIISTHSVFHKQLPPKKKYIRAFVYLNAYIIRELDTSSCELIYISHCDFGGKLHVWIVNKVTECMAPKLVKCLAKASCKYNAWKSSNRPEYKPWINNVQISYPLLNWADIEKRCCLTEDTLDADSDFTDQNDPVEPLVTSAVLTVSDRTQN